MTISVRFAPSPTGNLHIGNLRAALLNFLYARKHDGRFWLRLDDTDNERSRPEYAANIEQSLGWAGITWDRFTRQSDRLAEYEAAAETLKAAGRLYPAYETAEELALKRKGRLAQGLPPIYDRAALTVSDADTRRYEAEGRKPHWRFKLAPGTIEWPDIVHGMLKFDAATMSDPVLIREDGSPLFILSGVVDDAEFGITHIIRGDDHITNTAVQIQIFEALGAPIPVFAHFSQLVDAEGGKLSKRKGGLGIMELEEQGYEPLAIVNLLARLGTADPVEARTALQDVIDGFELTHFSKSAARLDFEELDRINARILHAMPFVDAQPRLTARGMAAMEETFWLSVRGNLTKFSDIDTWWQVAEGPVTSMIEDADFAAAAAELLPPEPWDDTIWGAWTAALKEKNRQIGQGFVFALAPCVDRAGTRARNACAIAADRTRTGLGKVEWRE